MFGGSDYYGPEILMQNQNIILVSINYRLGILGFLSTEDEVLPGNLGLKDQVEALKWVQRNIQAFNGDPKRVTIVGLSAGGASVHLHYMSNLSNGLFKNGISHSGVATNPWVMMENGREKAHKLGALMGCNFANDHKKLVKCLKKVPLEKLVMAEKEFQPFLYNPFSPFGVSVEINHKNAFISQHPLDILKSGNFSIKPWLASQVKDEGLYPASEFYNEGILKTFDKNWTLLAPHLLDFNGTSTDSKIKEILSYLIRNFYFQDQEISLNTYKNLVNVSFIL
jgi:carboxylesterase type B